MSHNLIQEDEDKMYCETCNADDPPHAPGCRAPDGELHRIYRDADEIQRTVMMATSAGGHSSGPLAIAALAERIKQRCLWEIAALSNPPQEKQQSESA